jgi:hypothetical protein
MTVPTINGCGPDAVFTTSNAEAVAELLNLCDLFLRSASPDVRAELRQFLIEHGHHPRPGSTPSSTVSGSPPSRHRRPHPRTPNRRAD